MEGLLLLERRRVCRWRRVGGSFRRWDARRRNLVSIAGSYMTSASAMRYNHYRKIIESLWRLVRVCFRGIFISTERKVKPGLAPQERHRACLSPRRKSRDQKENHLLRHWEVRYILSGKMN